MCAYTYSVWNICRVSVCVCAHMVSFIIASLCRAWGRRTGREHYKCVIDLYVYVYTSMYRYVNMSICVAAGETYCDRYMCICVICVVFVYTVSIPYTLK